MKKNNSRGFTLVEVLVSLSILSILILVFFGVINTSIKNNKKNEVDINALSLAQSEVENIRIQIKNNNTSNLKDLENNEIIIDADIENSYTFKNYEVKISVEKESDLLYKVKVTVSHKNSNYSKRNVQIITQVVVGRSNST